MDSSFEEDMRSLLKKRKYNASEIEEVIPVAKTFISLDFSLTTGLILSNDFRQRKQSVMESISKLLRSDSRKVRTLGGRLMKRVSEY